MPGRPSGGVEPSRLEPAGLVDLGVDQPGTDADDPDAVAGDLVGQPDGEGVEGGLAGRVVDVLAGAAEHAPPATRR